MLDSPHIFSEPFKKKFGLKKIKKLKKYGGPHHNFVDPLKKNLDLKKQIMGLPPIFLGTYYFFYHKKHGLFLKQNVLDPVTIK